MTMSDMRASAPDAPVAPTVGDHVLARHDLVHPDGRAFAVYGELHGTLDGQPADHDVSALHLRWDRATASWVAISPARNTRPGGVAGAASDRAPSCPLCPGGVELPFAYDGAVFDNRFPALSPHAPAPDGALTGASVGRCQVVVYTSDHEGSLSTLPPAHVARVVAMWRDRTAALWAEGHAYVMAFENHGADIGATLTHPHGQLYAFGFLPPTVQQKVGAVQAHREQHAECLGCALVHDDTGSERVIARNDSFVVAVPYAPRWPYEVHVRARRHGVGRLADLSDAEALDLARAVRDVVARFDGLFGFELPYMLCVQEAPAGVADWHLHVEFMPPHRDERRLKVRASVETALGVFINDTLPERSAERLAGVPVATTSWEGVAVPVVRPATGHTTTTRPAVPPGGPTHEGDIHA